MRCVLACLVVLLFSTVAEASPCQQGYTQFNGGDCFRTFATVNHKAITREDAEAKCNSDGGLLASIHNEEDDNLATNMNCLAAGNTFAYGDIFMGLRCVGIDCTWTDGTAVDYTRFFQGDAPENDGLERCYYIIVDHGESGLFNGLWQRTRCSETTGCFLCRMKARTIDCDKDETEYKGGCVSVHSTPVNQETAENLCTGGGNLVSVHSDEENSFYQKLASNAGITGSIYIGGFQNTSELTWFDRTLPSYSNFATGFPNPLFGSCVQMMLSTEFGTLGLWTSIDCHTKLSYICFRDGRTLPTLPPPHSTVTPTHQLADKDCPPVQYFTRSGEIYSPNYPFSIPSYSRKCEYLLATDVGTFAHVKFPVYDCQSGATLTVYDGLDSEEPILKFTSTPPDANRVFSASGNVIKLVFETVDYPPPVGKGWEAILL